MFHVSITKSRVLALVVALVLAVPPALPAVGQSLFQPLVRVDESVVTRFEVEQRMKLMEVLRSPDSTRDAALESLIGDRLKNDAAARAEILPTDEQVQGGIEEFAQRANIGAEEFLAGVASVGIAPETVADFISTNLAWGQLVRARFGDSAQPNSGEIDTALAERGTQPGAEVLLSEIILPLTPELAEESQARADAISELTTLDAFESAARRFSVSPSRENGGRIDWIAISNLPPQLGPLFLTMKVGDVTAPVTLGNGAGIGLFQFRGLRETARPTGANARLDFIRVRFAPGTDLAAERARLMPLLDQCNDLYGIFSGAASQQLQRETRERTTLPRTLTDVLDRLDANEYAILAPQSAAGGGSLVMLCSRGKVDADTATRNQTQQRLFSRALNSYAERFLADLRGNAHIEYLE